MSHLEVAAISGGFRALEDSWVDQFKAHLGGELLRPSDERYDAARRVWNGMIDKRPAMIARCAGTDDVVACVNFARENELLISVPRRRA